jgi:hypothetical protein
MTRATSSIWWPAVCSMQPPELPVPRMWCWATAYPRALNHSMTGAALRSV